MRPSTIVRTAVLAGVAAGAYLRFVRPWYLGWGATGEELRLPLPGDDLIPTADLVATRAVTVRAPADRVWPWIAQLGQGRGGLYSYDALENLIGCDMHSADRILPRWQRVAAGDEFKLHPDLALQVAAVEPPRCLVVRGGVPMGDDSQPPYDFTWSFVVQEAPAGTTRLLVRERYRYTRWWSPLLVEPVEALSFVMSQKMLRGLRDRVERAEGQEPSARRLRKV
jgi:hypothetical protein